MDATQETVTAVHIALHASGSASLDAAETHSAIDSAGSIVDKVYLPTFRRSRDLSQVRWKIKSLDFEVLCVLAERRLTGKEYVLFAW
jgi:hypothetical protein